MVQSLRQAVAEWDRPPQLVFFSRADESDSDRFFAQAWPGAKFISDPQGEWFHRYAVPRGGCAQLFGWRTWLAGLRAALKGHLISRPTRDPWQMPAYVLVREGRVMWSYHPKHAGDHPTWTPPPWTLP